MQRWRHTGAKFRISEISHIPARGLPCHFYGIVRLHTHTRTHTHARMHTHTHTHCACDSCNVPYPHACLPAYIPLDCSDCSKIAYIHRIYRISVPHTANRAITSTGLANHLSPLAPHDSERHFRSRTHGGRVDAPDSSFTPELCRGGDIS